MLVGVQIARQQLMFWLGWLFGEFGYVIGLVGLLGVVAGFEVVPELGEGQVGCIFFVPGIHSYNDIDNSDNLDKILYTTEIGWKNSG